MEGTHILKFVMQDDKSPRNVGIRTFPHQTYGVSKDSPDQFKKRHTLINLNGYQYQHQQAPQFEYRSQKRSLALAQSLEDESNLQSTRAQSNPYKFHLKKGRLTQFLDKNAWMNATYLLSGNERDEKSRSLCNRDRNNKIKALKTKIQYQNKVIKKPIVNQTYYNTLQNLMSERVRIRTRRNSEAEKHIPISQRTISVLQIGELEDQNIREKMSKTAQEWHPTLKTERKGRNIRDIVSRQSGISRLEDHFTDEDEKLQTWQRKTCHSKWKVKNQKVQTNQNQLWEQTQSKVI